MSSSLQPHGLYSLWNSPGQNIRVGSLSLLQEIFPTQGLNPGLLHCTWILYQLSHKGSPRILEWVAYPFSSRSSQPRNQTRVSCIAGGLWADQGSHLCPRQWKLRILTTWPPGKYPCCSFWCPLLCHLPPLPSPSLRSSDTCSVCGSLYMAPSPPSTGLLYKLILHCGSPSYPADFWGASPFFLGTVRTSTPAGASSI